ncbi:MAG TPA: iron ABC transporter permease [Bacteroidia bacterium]|nr:iron ABC transporter permease [Bacteroidia bacterium]
MRNSFILHVLILLLITVALLFVNLFFGTITISLSDLKDGIASDIFYNIRIPKTFTAILAGGSLAISGLLMQTLFRNPLAGPYVLGVSSGAGLFVAIAMILFGGVSNYFIGKSLIGISAVTGSLLVMSLVLFISKRSRSNTTVLLVGIMISQILGAFQGLIEYMSDPAALKSFVVWGMGSVSNTSNKDIFILLPVCLIFCFATLFLSKPLNAILLNETYAQNLGINVNRLRLIIIVITAVLTGLITAFCGPIAFVGLSVPIACRLLFKTSHQLHQITYCFLIGAITLLLCDSICQILSESYALPINTITTILGSPVVIYLIFKSKTIS